MRKSLALIAVLVLTACGGGGGGTNGASPTVPGGGTPSPTPTPATPQGYVKPTFTITIPPRSSAGGVKKPNFVSSATQSISITLTQVNGSAPGTLAGNPAISSVSGASCSTSCTISGPPSPIGNDTFSLTTYDQTGAAGHALDTNTVTSAISQGVANNVAVTLNGIPAQLSIAAISSFTAGTTHSLTIGPGATSGIVVTVADAAGGAITGTYANPVTITDADTNGDGTSVTNAACPASYPTGNTGGAASTVQFTSSSQAAANFCVGGIAENPATLTASATGATTGTALYSPTLAAPAYTAGSGTPLSVVVGTPPDVQLVATSGTGSTGSVLYTETGWTNAPYDQQLTTAAGTCSSGPLSTYATVSASTPSAGNGTQFSVTSIASPVAGQCTITITDGLIGSQTALLNSSYTTNSFTVNGRIRRP